MTARATVYTTARKKFGPTAPATQIAKTRLDYAEQEYQSTPKGIEELKNTAAGNPTEENIRAYRTGELTRQLQTNALSEINNQRFHTVSDLTVDNEKFLDSEEKKSILEASREYHEKLALQNPHQTVEPISEEQYTAYVNQLESNLSATHPDGLPDDIKFGLRTLRALPAPDLVSFQSYQYLPKAILRSKVSLNNEISKLASIQGVNKNVAQAYYEAYREQYTNEFATQPKTERPDPPTDWVRGETTNSGYTQDPNSMFAPRDAASLYAAYRLRSDEAATPDFLKTSKNYAALELEVNRTGDKLNPKTDTISSLSVVSFNSKGKEVSRYHQQVDNSPESTKKLSNILPQVSDILENKTLLTQNNAYQYAWLNSHLKNFDSSKSLSTVDTQDLSKKHLDLTTHSLSNICGTLQIPYPTKVTAESKAETAGLAYFEMKKYIRKTWNAKAARRNAPPLKTVPFGSRWDGWVSPASSRN